MFSIVNSLLLRQLPVREPARLVRLGSHEQEGYPEWSYPVQSEVCLLIDDRGATANRRAAASC